MEHGHPGEHPPQDKPKPPPLPLEALAEAELEASEEERMLAEEKRQERLAMDHEQALEDVRREAAEKEVRREAELEKARKIVAELKASESKKEKGFVEKWDETADKLDAWASDPKAIAKTLGTGFLFAGVTAGWALKHPLGLTARTAEWGLMKLEDWFVKVGTPKFVVDGMDKAIKWLHKKTGIKEEEVKKAAGGHGGGHDDHGKGDHGGAHAAHAGGSHGSHGSHGGGSHGSHGKKKKGGGAHH